MEIPIAAGSPIIVHAAAEEQRGGEEKGSRAIRAIQRKEGPMFDALRLTFPSGKERAFAE